MARNWNGSLHIYFFWSVITHLKLNNASLENFVLSFVFVFFVFWSILPFIIKYEILIFIVIVHLSEVFKREVMDIFPISFAERTISVIFPRKYHSNFYVNEIFWQRVLFCRGHLSQTLRQSGVHLSYSYIHQRRKHSFETWLLPKLGVSSLHLSYYFFYGRSRQEALPVIYYQVRFS